jgi:hypothetical protein
MARKPVDPMLAALQAEQREADRAAARERNRRRLRTFASVVVAAVACAALGWFLITHRDDIARNTPPADCTPPTVDIGCGSARTPEATP